MTDEIIRGLTADYHATCRGPVVDGECLRCRQVIDDV